MSEAALFAALSAFQGEVKNPEKTKTGKVQMKTGGSYQFRYADIADILHDVRPLLAKHGLSIVQVPFTEGQAVFLRTTLLHKDGAFLDGGILPLGGFGADMKVLGGNITYARRYAACAVLGIAAEEDVDRAVDDAQGRRAPPPPGLPPRRDPIDDMRGGRRPAPPPPQEVPDEPRYELTDEQQADEDKFRMDLDVTEDKDSAQKVWQKWKPHFEKTMSTELVKVMHGYVVDHVRAINQREGTHNGG